MLVSVIIPVYNSSQYLHKCLDSVIAQTIKNIEIVVVNDGSTDESESICQYYEHRDKRIKYIKKNHAGLVSARKEGLRQATGNLICWVDSDDWIESDYIENIMNLQKNTGADIVALSHYHDIGADSNIVKNGLKEGVYEVKDILDKVLYAGAFYEYGINPHLCTKMFKVDCIRFAEYAVENDITAGEDAAATYVAIANSNKICVSEICGYHYVQRAKSMTKITVSDEEKKIDNLISYLKRQFQRMGVYEYFVEQLKMYRKYITILRKIELFDAGDDNLSLMPYGGFAKGEKVIIYGAGVLGQMICQYVRGDKVNVVGWVDKNYIKYIADGYNVTSPDSIKYMEEYDKIIIANISGKVVSDIRRELINNGIPREKIKWFTREFLESDIIV